MAAFTARNVNRVFFRTCQSVRNFHNSTCDGRSEPVTSVDSGRRRVTMVPGDGVGPELMSSVQEVFSAAGVPVDFEEILTSEIRKELTVNTDKVIESCQRNKVCLKGIISSPTYYTAGILQTLNMKMRIALDLFANMVHVQSLPGFKTRHDNLDIVIIRESLEGEYSALEHESVPGVVEALKIVTRENSTRIARFAFDYAMRNGRKKVTAVHKANIMKLSDGLFLECCTEMSKLYPSIEFQSMIIDNTCMQLVSRPNQFDVMVMPNLYGNIVDNVAAGLVGGAGVVPGESHSDDIAVYEPGARHSFQEKSGKDLANPTAILLCAANMLRHLQMNEFSEKVRNAVKMTIKSGKVRTRDMGGYGTRSDFTRAVIDNLDH